MQSDVTTTTPGTRMLTNTLMEHTARLLASLLNSRTNVFVICFGCRDIGIVIVHSLLSVLLHRLCLVIGIGFNVVCVVF